MTFNQAISAFVIGVTVVALGAVAIDWFVRTIAREFRHHRED